jgi:hypothetical protein
MSLNRWWTADAVNLDNEHDFVATFTGCATPTPRASTFPWTPPSNSPACGRCAARASARRPSITATRPRRPSAEDIRLAYDPQLSYVIVSLAAEPPDVRSFRIRAGVVEAEPVEVL